MFRHRLQRRCSGFFLILFAAATTAALADDVALTSTAPSELSAGLCASTDPFAFVARLDGSADACVLAPKQFSLQTIYLQNASRVGGTALAAYPLVRIETGVMPRLAVSLDLPSEIAQSVPGGGGAFPITRPGLGLTYELAGSFRSSTALIATIAPPDSNFAPQHTQPRYTAGVAQRFTLTRKWTLDAQAFGTSSQSVGWNRVMPSLDVSTGFTPNGRTQIVTGLGTRISTKHGSAQSYTDLAVNQVLARKLTFSVGVGTTFNAVANTKPHYLASGFTYRP
jgi:hypothetical protein